MRISDWSSDVCSSDLVTKTVDPLSGSYYLEYLTSEIEEGVEKYLKNIEKIGGSLAAIETGFFQEEIRRNAYQLKKEIDYNDRIIVGVKIGRASCRERVCQYV